MSGGGGGGSGVTRMEPPSYAEPGLRASANAAGQLFNQGGPEYYPGRTVIPFSGQTERALGQIESLSGTSPAVDAANQQLTGTLQGDYLNSNPYLDQMFTQAADATRGRLTSEFARGGRDIQASAPARSQELQQLAASIYGGNYARERQNQMGALGYLPSVNRERFFGPGQLAGVGQAVEGQAGRLAADRQSRFDYEQNRPEMALDRYVGRLTGAAGQYGNQTQDQSKNRLAGALGGGLAGAAASTLPFFSSGAGAALGASLGGFGLPLIGLALGGLL